jgi:long-chain acyl-CoA synthetase
VIKGERDNYFPSHVFDDVGDTVPNAEVIDVGASKHKVQLERHQAVNRAIERFADEDKRHRSWHARVTTDSMESYRPWLDNYAAGTPHTVPVPRRPLHEFLESAADWLPKRKATVFFGSRLTYLQLNRMANQFAHVLHGMGIQPGDRVMILLPNMPQFVVAFYGTLRSGGVAVHANPDANATRIIAEARQTQAKVLVTLHQLSKLAQAVQANSDVREVILTKFETKVPTSTQKQVAERWRLASLGSVGDELSDREELGAVSDLTMADLMIDAPIDPPAVKVSSDSLAAILFTSGTTDAPKGVSLTHRNLVANALQTHHWIPDLQYGREVFLSVVPMLHSYGMTMAMNLPIAMGATMVLLPVFEPQLILEQVKAHGPTFFPGVPSMYSALNNVPGVRSYGLSSIRACLSGAAPLPIEVQETFEKLTLGRLVEGFGLTEASPATHANPINENRRPGSIGVPLPNTDAKIVDLSTGEVMPPGRIGQLLVKGPQVMRGYWMQEEATDEVLQDGWLDTGDVAVMDADGFFHIIGRTRDVIRAGEHTVYPRDVEELLYENAKVREVAVVGVPRSAEDQKVKAFVVPRSGVELSEDELMALCKRRLEPYAVPWEFEFRETLPRSFTGKVVRRLLVEE